MTTYGPLECAALVTATPLCVALTARPLGAPVITSSVDITFPAVVVFPIDVFHLRRALIGSSASRAYVAITQGGTVYAVDTTHEGSGANCTTWITALSGATRGQASLTAGARTGVEWATAVVTAFEALGVTGVTRDGATITIAGASDLVIGAPMVYDPTLRGIWGMQRHQFGTATDPNLLGNMGGTGSVHVGAPAAAGRVIGVYIRTGAANSEAVRLGIANGPAYSTTPAAFSGGVEGTSVDNGGLRLLRLTEPMAMSSAQNKWISFRGIGGGNPQLNYRAHNLTPEGNGDVPIDNNLLFSTTEGDPTVAIYTAGAYTHGAEAGPYAIYSFVGFVYEIAVDGAYPGDGGIETEVGTHATATAGGPTATVPEDQDEETFGMRHPIPWDCEVTAVAVAVNAGSTIEDMGMAFYSFNDLVAPSVLGADLLRDVGPMGINTGATGYLSHTLATPLAVTAGTVLDVHWNSGNIDGVTPSTELSVSYDPDTGSAEYWSTAWIDDGRAWNDMDPTGGNGYGQQTEYRTRSPFGGDMPEGDPSAVWPDPFDVDVSDDHSTRNHLRHRIHLSRAGITGEEI